MTLTNIPTELLNLLVSQQQQIAKLSVSLNALSTACQANIKHFDQIHEQILGERAAFQVFAEILMGASPDLKAHFAASLGQVLAKQDDTTNEHLWSVLEDLHQAAAAPSRLTPEGRRAWLHVVQPPDERK